uniref:Uncharacterized protein n=1 Tax=Chenopodium quinoa TaxID=63459 RepID=A0A803L6N6_CHEQI
MHITKAHGLTLFVKCGCREDFTAYANVCFREFGDRVLYRTTYNEPNMFAEYGYDHGLIPPQICSEPFGSCTKGNSTTEPYLVAHNLLLAHASVVRLYRKTYQGKQHGFIGLNLYAESSVPETNIEEDLLAVQRARDFRIG